MAPDADTPLTAEEEAALRADLLDHRPDALAPEERHLMRRVLATLDATRAAPVPDGTREFVAFAVEYLRLTPSAAATVAAGDRILAQLDALASQPATASIDVGVMAPLDAYVRGFEDGKEAATFDARLTAPGKSA